MVCPELPPSAFTVHEHVHTSRPVELIRPKCSPAGLARCRRHGAAQVDVYYLRESAFVGHEDVNLDFHFHAQWGGTRNQCPVAVYDDRLAVTSELFVDALSRNYNL